MLARGEKNVRSPILVQVEEQGERQNCLGRARNISLSGVLMETPDTLAEGAGVIIRFFVPPDRSPIETAGRVVKSEPGNSMVIAFLGLPESQKEKLLAYLKTVDSTGFPELVPAIEKGLRVVESGRPYVLDVHVAPGYAQPPPARSAG